ncbi:MAG TPA: hypothetical protein VFA49_09980 [Chloroflexota bacterium]|nr:hypothetical protein [Chloroflexota bacterium]
MPRPRYHAAVSLGLAALVVARGRRWRDALPVLVAGVLVDIDHLVDLAATRATGKTEWAILPLHAWEWVFGLLARGGRVRRGLAGGLAAHLALDQLNPVIRHPFFYWLVVRAAYGFKAKLPLADPERVAHGARWMLEPPTRWF